MIEQLRYHSVEELQALSLDELQALWELVPTERQKSYRTAYDREVRNAGAIGSDDLEQRVAAELLSRYVDGALVPVGSRWARTPERVQAAAKENDLPEIGDDAVVATAGQPSPKVMIGIGLMVAFFLVFMLLRLTGGDDAEAVTTITPEASITPTPEVSPTPTPLALEAQDDVITDGDADQAVAYPVNLQVVTADDSAPRLWVVQRREVAAAEWKFDPNPDIASFVNGMSVRPVIGIPWSEENAAFFETLTEGAVFNLTMNTGAILQYEFASKSEVLRSDTRIFRQVGPGLVLLLIGETDEDGLPTATRTLITATYPHEQELGRLDALIALAVESDSVTPTPTPTPPAEPTGKLSVQFVSVTTSEGRITTRLRIYNGQITPITFTSDDIWLALGYAPDPPGPRNPAEGMQPFTLLPEQAVDLILVWYWGGEPFGALQIREYRFRIMLLSD